MNSIKGSNENGKIINKTLRILNGSLKGCEFSISASRTLVITSNQSLNEKLLPINELPTDTIFLPLYEKSSNFEIYIREEDKFIIRELAENGTTERECQYNKIISVGEILFAIKDVNVEWTDDVLNVKKLQDTEGKKKIQFLSPVKKHYMIVYLIITTLMLTLISAGISLYTSESNYMRRLNQILTNRDLIFSEGRDHKLYILAQDNRKAIWANQVVERGDFSSSRVRVISPDYEIQRVYSWLTDNFPALKYFRLQLGRSLIPTLMISKQRSTLSEQEMNDLKKRIMEYMPYIEDIKIVEVDDEQLVNEAEQGLQSLGIKYEKKHTGDYYSFNINGELNDSEILRLKQFINEFHKQWGKEYIIFNVALKSDLLKDQSYTTGDMNYIKKSGSDWYFIKPQSE